jgi:hypothetical protein
MKHARPARLLDWLGVATRQMNASRRHGRLRRAGTRTLAHLCDRLPPARLQQTARQIDLLICFAAASFDDRDARRLRAALPLRLPPDAPVPRTGPGLLRRRASRRPFQEFRQRLRLGPASILPAVPGKDRPGRH